MLIKIISNSSVRESLLYTKAISRAINKNQPIKAIKLIVLKSTKTINNALRSIKIIKKTLISRYSLR